MTTMQIDEKKKLSYSSFSLERARRDFALDIVLKRFLQDAPLITPTELLSSSLQRASTISLISEKARSEFIVAPILLEVKEVLHHAVSVYSGVRLDVSPEDGLQGVCDFVLSKSPPLPTLQAPLIMMVEAKKNDVEQGLGQCTAEMVAAQRFNAIEDKMAGATIYGCVTTGELWQFLQLENNELAIDPDKIYIEHVDRILGMLVAMAS